MSDHTLNLLSKAEKVRCVRLIGQLLTKGVALDDEELFSALYDLLVLSRWPSLHVVALCDLDRRKHARSTDVGGVDGPPYDRSMAENEYAVNPEVGARAMGDEAAG